MRHLFIILTAALIASSGTFAFDSFYCDENAYCNAIICGGCVDWLDSYYDFGTTLPREIKVFHTGLGCPVNQVHRVVDMWFADCTFADEWSGVVARIIPFNMRRTPQGPDEVAVDITFAPNSALHGPGPREAIAVICVQSLNDGSYSYCELYLDGYANPSWLGKR